MNDRTDTQTIQLTPELKRQLQRQIPHISREIRMLYQKLDRRFGLSGASVPVTFGFETDVLGSYSPEQNHQAEHFHFSLLFIGYLNTHQVHAEDKADLFLHEYAHYMEHHMDIPSEYTWQSGKHGSAWKYCCSLVGAAPSAYYRFGKGTETHDYEKALRNPWKDPDAGRKDNRRRRQEAEDARNRELHYSIGDHVSHPKFGDGTVTAVEQLAGSVRLSIDFGGQIRKIDQKWLLRSIYQKR